jgi:hypothetical protein
VRLSHPLLSGPQLRRQLFWVVGAPSNPKKPEFDFRAHACHSAAMETHAFGFRLPAKNVEALANALPLVTTTHFVRGLAEGVGHALIVADDPAVFAAALDQFIADAGAYAACAFSPEACFGPLLAVIARS